MKNYTLEYPIEFGGETITTLELLRPKGKHVRKLDVNNIDLDQLLTLAGNYIGGDISHTVINELDGVDCIGIAEVYGDFLASGPRITGQ